VFFHLFKLKNDFLNIFYFDYSFSPYTIAVADLYFLNVPYSQEKSMKKLWI